MDKIANLKCSKCGAEIPIDRASANCYEEDGVLLVRYDPVHTKIVLINAESGSRRTVDVSDEKSTAKPASRQIGGIIGPY